MYSIRVSRSGARTFEFVDSRQSPLLESRRVTGDCDLAGSFHMSDTAIEGVDKL
jgi:hypothetical protein